MARFFIIFSLVLLTVPVMGQSSQSGAVLIRNVRVSDGETGALVNSTVLVVDGHVSRVGPGDRVPAGAIVIDGGGSLITVGADGAIRLIPARVASAADQPSDQGAVIRTASVTKTGSSLPTDLNSTRLTSDGVQPQPSAPQSATPQAAPQSTTDLAQQAADPTAPLMAFNFKIVNTPSFYGVPGSGNAFVFQPVVPFKAWGLAHLLRTTVTYTIDGPGGTGLDNVSVFDLMTFNKKWGRWGVGPLVSFSANKGPGRDTFSAGPAIGFVARKGKWNLGLFNQNLFGGKTRFSSIQPIISYNLGSGWTVASGDAQWSIDWSKPEFVNIPFGVQIAKLIRVDKQPVRFSVNPQYNARNVTGTPHWNISFQMTILAPGK